jgi:hypothetical protein
MDVMADPPQTLIKVTLTHSILSIRIPEVRVSKMDKIADIKVALEDAA